MLKIKEGVLLYKHNMKESVNMHLNVKCHNISPQKKREKEKKVVRSNRGHFVRGF